MNCQTRKNCKGCCCQNCDANGGHLDLNLNPVICLQTQTTFCPGAKSESCPGFPDGCPALECVVPNDGLPAFGD
jgi:hypothetical protein